MVVVRELVTLLDRVGGKERSIVEKCVAAAPREHRLDGQVAAVASVVDLHARRVHNSERCTLCISESIRRMHACTRQIIFGPSQSIAH